MAFWWLGYDWWSEQENQDGGSSEPRADRDDEWVWVNDTDNTLTHSDLEFFEKRGSEQRYVSYADAVKASFERCKKTEEEVEIEKNENKMENDWNLAKATILPQDIDYFKNESVPMLTRFERKRKSIERYQPFPKQGRLSSDHTSKQQIFSTSIIPFDASNISISHPKTSVPEYNGWKTVGKRCNHFRKINFEKAFKSNRFAIDVSSDIDMNNCLLRMRSCPSGMELPNSNNIMEFCKIVEDVQQPIRNTKLESKFENILRKTICLKFGKKNSIAWKYQDRCHCIPNKNRSSIMFDYADSIDVQSLKYVLGIEPQPLSIEWNTCTDRSVQTMSHAMQYVEQLLTGLFTLAVSMTTIEVPALQDFDIFEVPRPTENIEEIPNRKQMMKEKRDRKRDMLSQVIRERKQGYAFKQNGKKKSDVTKRANMTRFRQGRQNSKNRNFMARRFSGRGGVRAC